VREPDSVNEGPMGSWGPTIERRPFQTSYSCPPQVIVTHRNLLMHGGITGTRSQGCRMVHTPNCLGLFSERYRQFQRPIDSSCAISEEGLRSSVFTCRYRCIYPNHPRRRLPFTRGQGHSCSVEQVAIYSKVKRFSNAGTAIFACFGLRLHYLHRCDARPRAS
jgi:hypothetical protein